jgi:hypothetical protein
MVEHAKNGNLMNIKENFHIYHFNKLNKLIEEQKLNKENDNQNGTHPHKCHEAQGV